MQGYFENASINACIAEQMISFAGQHITLSQEERGNDDFLFHSAFHRILPYTPWSIFTGLAVEIASLITN